MNLQEKSKTRRITYSDSSSSYEAYFHGWTRDSDNKMVAVIEHMDGTISIVSMISCIKFFDRNEI